MASKSSSYSMKNVTATIDGQIVIGFWDGDDAVTVAPASDRGTMTFGADGSSIFSGSANKGATITLRLQHTSPSHRLLLQRLARQEAEGIRIVGFPFTVNDVDSGEGGATSEAFISAAPTDGKGVNATVREWTLVTGQWQRNITKP